MSESGRIAEREGAVSEYQDYEFVAVDRPLSEGDLTALRGLSSRARITATRFTNHYQYGDFRGDPARLMRDWFDPHLYTANWGTRRLMVRLPRRLVDEARIAAMLAPVEAATARRARIVATRRRGEGAWRDVETEIERCQGTSCDRAATLLADLRVVAEEGGTQPEFARRLDAIRTRHARKERFIERLRGL